MKLIESVSPDFYYPDDRGVLVQIAREGVAQVNAVFTKKGAVRGNDHYHRQTAETFYVLSGRVRVRASLDGETETAEFETGSMFRIPAFVRHCFSYLADTYLVVLYSAPVELPDGSKDIIPGGKEADPV